MTRARTPSTVEPVRLRRFRPNPLKVDWVVAAALAVVGELEVWLGSGSVTHHHRIAIGISMAVMAGTVPN